MSETRRVRKGELTVGGRYLHLNGQLVREIDAIEGGIVSWHDENGQGQCSQATFVAKCLRAVNGSEIQSLPRHRVLATIAGTAGPSDEAKALATYALDCSPLMKLRANGESGHPGSRRVSAEEFGRLLAWAAARLDVALKLKNQSVRRYELFIREQRADYARKTGRDSAVAR